MRNKRDHKRNADQDDGQNASGRVPKERCKGQAYDRDAGLSRHETPARSLVAFDRRHAFAVSDAPAPVIAMDYGRITTCFFSSPIGADPLGERCSTRPPRSNYKKEEDRDRFGRLDCGQPADRACPLKDWLNRSEHDI